MDPNPTMDRVVTADGVPACGAVKRQAVGRCMKRRGWGTEHVGYGRCKLHGGNSPAGAKAALTERMNEELATVTRTVMGTAIDVDPMDALVWCVRITAGEVAYATYKVEQLTPQDEIVTPVQTLDREGGRITQEVTTFPEELNLWIKIRQSSVDRLARFSKMAIDAGVAKRQLELAEEAGDALAASLRLVLDGLALSPEQERLAPDLVRSALERLEIAASGSVPVGLPDGYRS
jgi:hypothetical protein